MAMSAKLVSTTGPMEQETPLDRADVIAMAEALGREFAATAQQYDRSGAFPHANFARLHEAGLLALAAPRRYGGQEIDLTTALAVINAIARGEPSTALILAQQYLLQQQLRSSRTWPEAMKRLVSESAALEGALANNLRVEPELGSLVRGGIPNTRAQSVPQGWRINGHKIFSTGAPGLRWFAVWATTDDEVPRIGTFLVARDTPGLRIEETWNHLGMRASCSHDVILEDVFVPADHAVDIRPPEAWRERDDSFAAWGALMFASIYDGVARAARDWFIGFLHARVPSNLGAALATLPHMQAAVGDMQALLQVNRLTETVLAARTDASDPPAPHESYLAKHTINANSIAVVEKAVALIGNPALTRDHPLERHLRDVLCSRVHSPQADTVLGNAGRIALGLQTV